MRAAGGGLKEPADANVMRMIQPAVVPAIDKLGYARIASINVRQRIYSIPFPAEAELRTANRLRSQQCCGALYPLVPFEFDASIRSECCVFSFDATAKKMLEEQGSDVVTRRAWAIMCPCFDS